MFSREPRCCYRANQIQEVICQLRFPDILAVGASAPVDFQEAIRQDFPIYTQRQELVKANQEPVKNHQFSSADGTWRVNLTAGFISLSCSGYRCWEEFAQQLDKPLAAFIKIYRPAFFQRIGLRYLNVISRNSLSLAQVPFRELICPTYLGPLALEQVQEQLSTRCSTDCDIALQGGCRAKIHAGPGTIARNGKQDPETKFIFDLDLYIHGNLPVKLSAGCLQTLHGQAFPIFRYAITDRLHDAMEPDTM